MAGGIDRARLTALSLAHGSALARLLRTHGRDGHADGMDAALQEIFRIVAAELGGRTLSEAIRWIAEQADETGEEAASSLRH